MKNLLPKNPTNRISISIALKILIAVIFAAAKLFGFWKKPFLSAPSDVEEMSTLHKIYWLYKSKYPILKNDSSYDIGIFNKKKISISDNFIEESCISLSAVGDLINSSELENSKDYLYKDVYKDIFDADISIANLEAMIFSEENIKTIFSKDKAPSLGFTMNQYEAIKGHEGKNYTILQTACNHSFDFGERSLMDTIKKLEEDNIINIGTNKTLNEYGKAVIIEKKGIKIGLISAAFGLNGHHLPEDKKYLINIVKFHSKNKKCDTSLLIDQINYCKSKNANFILASLHWGYEYEFFPRYEQLKISHDLAEYGVNLIISHHPHVLQPVEFYKTDFNTDCPVPIIYSLGNLTSSFSDAHLVLSGILNVKISKGKLNGKDKTFISNLTIIPVAQVEKREGAENKLQIQKLKSLMESKNDKQNFKKINKMIYYTKQIFGEDWCGKISTNTLN